MNKYIETRILEEEKLRRVCEDHRLFTLGEYDQLFRLLYINDGMHYHYYANMTTEKLAEIAEYIFDHSDSAIQSHSITDIMYVLSKACYSLFNEV